MFCPKCGQQNDDTAKFCAKCGNALNAQAQPAAQAQPVSAADNSKLFNVLSYIGILWLFGMLINPEKNDPKVRFHVGQGIILTITSVALNIDLAIVNAIIRTIFGFYASIIASLFTGLLSLAVAAVIITLMVLGIINAVKGEQKPLPVIGNLAFYK